MTRIPGLRKLVVALINSLPMLFDVFVLMSFLFTLFGIVGIELFSEKVGGTWNCK